MNYKVGQTIKYFYESCPSEGVIVFVGNDRVRVKPYKRFGYTVNDDDWTEEFDIWELSRYEDQYKCWRKDVENIKNTIDTPQKLISLLIERMDMDHEDYETVRQACIEQTQVLFSKNLKED